jgi:hypothetical protein
VPALQPLSKTREDQRKRRKIDDPLRALVDLSWFLYTWNRSDQFNQAPPSIQKIDVVVVLHIMPENQRKPAKTSEKWVNSSILCQFISISRWLESQCSVYPEATINLKNRRGGGVASHNEVVDLAMQRRKSAKIVEPHRATVDSRPFGMAAIARIGILRSSRQIKLSAEL